jgi:2-polyprenyl-3-methyl-5-hydroxy-6-metoxy-1,4-benzoquinol methylase
MGDPHQKPSFPQKRESMVTIDAPTMPCPVCGFTKCSLFYSLPFPFARCGECGLLFRTDRNNHNHPNLAYETEGPTSRSSQLVAQEPARHAYTKSRVERICRHRVPPGSLLEIGVGTGSLLAEFKELGWKVEGIEPSPTLHEYAINRLGEADWVHHCDLSGAEEELRQKPYRIIVALDVIEHLTDPFMLPRKAFDWLEPGGYLFLQTPNVKSLRHRLERQGWEQLAPDEHCILHSSKSLREVIGKSGFEVVEIRTLSGGALDSSSRRLLMTIGGACLSLLGLGNALWLVARRKRS